MDNPDDKQNGVAASLDEEQRLVNTIKDYLSDNKELDHLAKEIDHLCQKVKDVCKEVRGRIERNSKRADARMQRARDMARTHREMMRRQAIANRGGAALTHDEIAGAFESVECQHFDAHTAFEETNLLLAEADELHEECKKKRDAGLRLLLTRQDVHEAMAKVKQNKRDAERQTENPHSEEVLRQLKEKRVKKLRQLMKSLNINVKPTKEDDHEGGQAGADNKRKADEDGEDDQAAKRAK